jgi:hypothetical protein
MRLRSVSPTGVKLFIIAGILCFCEIPVAFISEKVNMAAAGGIFGVFFLIGAYFAHHGTKVPIYDDYGRDTGRHSDVACYCGFTGLLAIAALFLFSIPMMTGGGLLETVPVIIPGVLGGLTAFIAGIVYMKQAYR